MDWGVEGGGPLMRNRLFAWGAYGKTEPEIRVFNFDAAADDYLQVARDATTLENISAKVTGEISTKARGHFTFFQGNKIKFGRGASGQRPDETTHNQDGPTSLYKGELNYTIGSHLFLVGRYAHTESEFTLIPRGGVASPSWQDDSNVYHGSYYFYGTKRPQDNVSLDGNMFKGRHDLKFGFGWRKSGVTSESGWPGGGVRTFHDGYPDMTAQVVRDWAADSEGKYWSAYAGDTISFDRLTLNLGVRWDRSSSSVLAASVPASAVLPDLMPALTAPAIDDAIVWNTITPRLGVTYALNESRRTIARGSYAAFASQLDANRAALTVSAIPYYWYAYYSAVDLNGNRVADPDEFQGLRRSARVRPGQPARRQPRSHRRLQLAADARADLRHRARGRAQLRPQRQRHVAAVQRHQLAELSRGHRRQLRRGGTVHGDGVRRRRLRRPLLPCRRERAAGGPRPALRDAIRLLPALPRFRDRGNEAHGGPLDDAHRLLDQQPQRVL